MAWLKNLFKRFISNLSTKATLGFFILIVVLPLAEFQISSLIQTTDQFTKELCRERWHRLDWKRMLQPCFNRIEFGQNMLPSTLRTNAVFSRILSMDIQRAGEYSKIIIETLDQFGRIKTIGGDTWRILITGPSSLQPIVHDMNNGKYEIAFLLMEPGFYKADIFLEGTLCSQYFDPPRDWFKKGDYNGHFQESKMYKKYQGWPKMLEERQWERLGGNYTVIQFQIYPSDHYTLSANMEKLRNWQNLCNIPDTCDYVWDGFGRWVGNEWKLYNDQEKMTIRPSWDQLKNSKRKKEGVLWFYGDCFAHHFYELVWNQSLCRDVFKECEQSYNWVYPRLNPVHELDPSIHMKDSSDISINKILSYLRKVLRNKNMDENSAIVLNYGLHFVRSTNFENYKKLILGVVRELKYYKGQMVWRGTTSVWKQHWKVHKRFQTNQRVQLFNAFAASTLCNAGYSLLDVFPLTSSTIYQPADAIHYENRIMQPIENVLINYFINDAK